MPVHRHSIFEIQKEKLGGYVYLSVFSHLLVGVIFFFLPSYLNPSADPWGDSQGGGGSISVGLVQQSAIRGLNLPRPKQTTASNIATESKGLGQTEEAKAARIEEEVPDPKAFEVKKKTRVRKRKRSRGGLPSRLPRRLRPKEFPLARAAPPTSPIPGFEPAGDRGASGWATGFSARSTAGM